LSVPHQVEHFRLPAVVVCHLHPGRMPAPIPVGLEFPARTFLLCIRSRDRGIFCFRVIPCMFKVPAFR
jgi:hypothetical protein